jgi:hypothetical protein
MPYAFICLFVCLMVFNTTFNNISVISWRSVLLMEETGGPGENYPPVESHWQTLSHSVVHLIKIRTHNISGDKYAFDVCKLLKISLETNKEYFPKQSLWSIEPTGDDWKLKSIYDKKKNWPFRHITNHTELSSTFSITDNDASYGMLIENE